MFLGKLICSPNLSSKNSKKSFCSQHLKGVKNLILIMYSQDKDFGTK